MYELPRIISAKGRTIKIANMEGTDVQTYLTAAVAASGTALTVADNSGFANTNLILIGELGSEKTEIKKVNAVVTAGTAMTSSAVTFAHPVNCPVKKILFNQFKIYGTTTNVYAVTNLIATVDMQVDSEYTEYVNTGTEYAYYWVVPYDSLSGGAVTGDNSNSIPKDTSYDYGTVGSLIKMALRAAKQSSDSVSNEFLIDEINECLRYMSGKLKHWSGLQSFNYRLGTVSRGEYSYTLPTDMEDRNTNKSILGVRVGSGENLVYQDKREWEDLLDEVTMTEVRTQAEIGDITFAIDNSYDFPDSGSVNYYIANTLYTITYTGVTRSATAGVLTGVPATGTGSITIQTPVDTKVWHNEEEGIPSYFTVYDGSLYLWPLADSTYDNNNIWCDYYTCKSSVSGLDDTLEFPRYDGVKHWLIAKIRAQNNASGLMDLNDSDFIIFNQILNDMIRLELGNQQKYKMVPKVNRISY